jgi:hypothetical protein
LGYFILEHFLREYRLKLGIDCLQEVIFNCSLVVFEFVEHVAKYLIVCGSVGLHCGQRESIIYYQGFRIGEVPLQFVTNVSLQGLLVGDGIRGDCTGAISVERGAQLRLDPFEGVGYDGRPP